MTNKEKRESACLSVREVVAALKPQFPRISLAAVSLAERPSESGITYTREAVSALNVLTDAQRPRTTDNRQCPIRIQARLTKADSEALNSARRLMGHDTVNDALVYAIHWYIRTANRKAAAGSSATHDGTTKHTNIII